MHTILAEEWEHLRYALRDLTALEEAGAAPICGSGQPAYQDPAY